MVIKRGTGREALIEAAATVLARGEDVQITEVAATVGVSHTLIYRHFPHGGKDELVAEGYARLFRGVAKQDFDLFFDVLQDVGLNRASIRDFYVTVIDPKRADVRWARLEALVQARTNPHLEKLIESSRQALINDFADRLTVFKPGLDRQSALSISLLMQSIPLGLIAIAGSDIAESQRVSFAEHCADALVLFLTR
jgi:AcrR family transcriptional regulator